MGKYYFKTKYQMPDEQCIERCNVKNDGTMIGSYSCSKCPFHVENNMTEHEHMTWLKCSKLQDALSK
jgi:hypothetical protein